MGSGRSQFTRLSVNRFPHVKMPKSLNRGGNVTITHLVLWPLVDDGDALIRRHDSERLLVDQSAVTERAQVGQIVWLL